MLKYNCRAPYVAVNGETDPGEEVSDNWFHACFQYKTNPADAVPPGNIQADLAIGLKCYWSGYFKDCDSWDQDGDSVSVSFSISYIAGGAIGYSWQLNDKQEGMVAGDYAYSTGDGLGGNEAPNNTPFFAYETGDCPDDVEADWEKSVELMKSATKSWQKSDTVKGHFDLSTGAYVTPHCAGDYVRAHMSLSNPVVKIENIKFISNKK